MTQSATPPRSTSGAAARAAAALALVGMATGCRLADEDNLRQARFRWGESGAWAPIVANWREPPGRGDADTLHLCFEVPPLPVENPALRLDTADRLVAATARGRPVTLAPDSTVVSLAEGSTAQEACLVYRAWYPLVAAPVTAGSQRELVLRAQRGELAHFAVGLVLAAIGAVLVLASLRRDGERVYRWMGLFAVTMGVLSIGQSSEFRGLILPAPDLWRWVRGVGLSLCPVGLMLFVREVFGDTRRRWILRVTQGLVAATAVVALLEALHLASILETRRMVYAFMAPMLALGTHRILVHVRAGDRGARFFLFGLMGMMLVSVPDIAVGLGIDALSIWRAGSSNVGVLVLVISLGAVAEHRLREQRRALAASTERLAKQVEELERSKADVEGLAEELRHQLERRSRELGEALRRGAPQERADPSAGVFEQGDVIDERYRVEGRLGAGAMGVVHEVARLTDGRRFALKVMTGAAGPEQAARFAREAEITARQRHPNLVSLVDVGVVRQTVVYLVMELVRSGTLEDHRQRFGDVAWGLPLLVDVARGLCALHEAGIVHRDLKPSNVLVELRAEGGSVARVADFGVARPLDRAALGSAAGPVSMRRLGVADTVSPPAPLTVDGELVGTPRYMPPEAAMATGATPAADVFALGLVICEVLAGRYPFASVPLFSALSGEPPRLLEIGALPAPLAALVPRMLDGLAERRPAASEVLQALEEAGGRPA